MRELDLRVGLEVLVPNGTVILASFDADAGEWECVCTGKHQASGAVAYSDRFLRQYARLPDDTRQRPV